MCEPTTIGLVIMGVATAASVAGGMQAANAQSKMLKEETKANQAAYAVRSRDRWENTRRAIAAQKARASKTGARIFDFTGVYSETAAATAAEDYIDRLNTQLGRNANKAQASLVRQEATVNSIAQLGSFGMAIAGMETSPAGGAGAQGIYEPRGLSMQGPNYVSRGGLY